MFSLFSFVWQGVTGFLPDFLHVQKEFSEALASNLFAGLFVVAAIVTPLVGTLGDRVGHARVAVFTPLVASVGLVMRVLVNSLEGVLISQTVLAAGLGSFWPLLFVHLMDALPSGEMGGDFGATRTVFMGLGSFGPVYVGIVVDFTNYVVAFAGFVVCLLLTAVLLIIVAQSE